MSFWKKLPKPFVCLAPMEDVTDTVFRQMVIKAKRPDVFFTEFVSVEGLLSDGKEKVGMRLKYCKNEKPIVAQIWGKDPESFYKAAKIIQALGFDGIDINFGCPQRKILKKGACIALIDNKPVVSQIINATKKGAGNLPVSVKTRIGLKTIATEDWISFLLKQNLAALTVHGRTAKEMSKVPAHWDEIGKAVAIRNQFKLKTYIIGNGDVQNSFEALEQSRRFGVEGVMIGRGIFKNLWAFEKNQNKHTPQEKLSLLINHLKLFKNTWKNQKRFMTLKKYFKIYVQDWDGAKDLRTQLMKTSSFDAAEKLIDNYLFSLKRNCS